MSFFGVIITVLSILKLAGLITLSWWWIISPIWIPLLFIFFVAFISSWD